MGSSRYSPGEYTITDPDSMSSSALLDISLTQLSKALSQTTPPRATFSIYLRWLDVHRREPTKCTEHWQNTLLHWTQSLRSRGFREYEIVAAVEDWKDANGPFRSQWRRYPPSPKEIAQAFDPEMERTRQMERVRIRERDLAVRLDRPLGASYRNQGLSYGASDSPHRSRPEPNRAKKKGKYHPENYEGNPPPNYICNRCGKKGHHLQVCPTNLDPSFDSPPGDDYECEICKAVGNHFKSLCPRNTDPLSIIQKRRAQGIRTPQAHKGKVYLGWRKEVEDQKDTERREEQRKARLREGRLTQESSNASVASSSPSQTPKYERLMKLEEIEDKKARLLKDESIDIDEIMAGTRYDTGVDNDRKRSRLDDHYGSSSRGASPVPSLAGRMQKKARTSDSNEITSSPRETQEIVESPTYTPRSDNHSLARIQTDTEMVDMVKTGSELSSAKNDNDAAFYDDLKAQQPFMRQPREDSIKQRQEEEARKEAVKKERIRVKSEAIGRPLTKNEERYAVENCKQFNNGYTCTHAEFGFCPFFHNQEARNAALEGMNYHRLLEEQKMNPDEMDIGESDTDYFEADNGGLRESNCSRNSAEHRLKPDWLSIDESDTDTSEEMDIELSRPPKQYSNLVRMLMLSRPEMSEVVNAVKKRPTAIDMWKLDDQRRREEMDANMPDLVQPSPPYSPFKSEHEESTSASNTSEPSGGYARVTTLQYAQFDGACDERPTDEKVTPGKKSSAENKPSLHRTISNTGKKAIEKVKELTTHVAEDLQSFKFRAVSPYRALAPRSQEVSPSKQTKQTANARNLKRINAEESLNDLRVKAASSALKLTEENIKGLAPDTRPVSHASQHSFGSLVVNLPGDRPPKIKPVTPNAFAHYAGRQSPEAMQNCETKDNQATQQVDKAGFPHKMSAPSDATDLQSTVDQPSLDHTKPCGAGG